MHPLCTIRLLVLNRSPVLVVIISVICDPQHGDIVLQVDQQHLDWLPYSFSDHVHQTLFFIILHPSLLLPGTILINSFFLLLLFIVQHHLLMWRSNGWVCIVTEHHVISTSDVSYFSVFFVSLVCRKRYSNTKKIFHSLCSYLEPEWIHFSKT